MKTIKTRIVRITNYDGFGNDGYIAQYKPWSWWPFWHSIRRVVYCIPHHNYYAVGQIITSKYCCTYGKANILIQDFIRTKKVCNIKPTTQVIKESEIGI